MISIYFIFHNNNPFYGITKKLDVSSIRKSLDLVSWEKLFCNKNIHSQVSILYNFTISNIFSNFVPNKITTCSDNDHVWMNEKIRWKLKLKISSTKYTSKIVKVDFLNLKNSIAELNKFVSANNTSYYENLSKKLNNLIIQTKSYWSILKSFYNNKENALILYLLIIDKLVTYTKPKANIFDKFFAEQCTLWENESVLSTSHQVLAQLSLRSFNSSCKKRSKIMRTLDVNKAHGNDYIYIRIIKNWDNALVRPLSFLLKKSFENSYWKSFQNWMSYLSPK